MLNRKAATWVLIVAALLGFIGIFFLTGCMQASYRTRQREETRTPEGAVTITEKQRDATVTDSTGTWGAFGSLLDQFDWKGFISAAWPVLVPGGVGAVGLGGAFLKLFASHHQSKGRRQERSAAKGLPTP